MKGISTVIATILMLMITIALAGTAYLYISGTFTQQTAIVLELVDSVCTDPITTTVQNSGTQTAATVTVTVTRPAGTSLGTCTITSLAAATSNSCSIERVATDPAGVYSVAVTASGARPVRGPVTCSVAGTT